MLVYLGQDLDGGADLVSKYRSIAEMPVLASDDSLFDDSRWKSLATLTQCTWFTRAWVLQEVGLAKDPSDPVCRSRLQLPRFRETGSVGRAMRAESGTARFGFVLLYAHGLARMVTGLATHSYVPKRKVP